MRELDCRGEACPHPVVKTRQALGADATSGLVVLVSEGYQAKNVAAVGDRFDIAATVKEESGFFRVEFPAKQ